VTPLAAWQSHILQGNWFKNILKGRTERRTSIPTNSAFVGGKGT
jgi:hypothetical protein